MENISYFHEQVILKYYLYICVFLFIFTIEIQIKYAINTNNELVRTVQT